MTENTPKYHPTFENDVDSAVIGENNIINNYYRRPPIGVPFQAPSLPRYFVERPEVSQELKERLLSQETAKVGTLVISAIYGLGGIGKSVLATALAYDPDVQSYFTDGIFWATLGQQPDILSFLHSWIQALGDYDFKPTNIDSATLQLRTLLSNKKALLVVDDLWNVDDIEPFQIAGQGCRVLVTTRETPVKGASRYDLDIMTQEQSLELLTSCLTNQLTNEELEQAKTLAKTVGYLPLALELAAAQISEGFTWDELLSGLQEELETLDRLEAEETPSEEKRKNYSLIASFNLSLKRLSPERLKQFAWLGVLPDDVTITEKMATTLWDCSLIKAKKTLIYLRNKALLLPGVSSDEGTSYRLHDLLLDLARNLLQASSQPEEVFQLPGLGLSIADAHQTLLKRYQKKTKNGLWHSLDDDGYIYNQLIWHLEKAEKIEAIHQLLKEETPEGNNGWYSKCEKQGKTINFIKDVLKAWSIAEKNCENNPTESISLQVRYALIITSLNSLAKNLGPDMIAALIEKEIWTPAQGLTYVKQSPDCQTKAEGLRKIIKYLPPSLLTSALKSAREIEAESERTFALCMLTPYFPEVSLEALKSAREIQAESERTFALCVLAPYFPEVLPEVLKAVNNIQARSERTFALCVLAPYFPKVLPEVLKTANQMRVQSERDEFLRKLTCHFPESLQFNSYIAFLISIWKKAELLPEALEAARAIKDSRQLRQFLGELTAHFPEVLPEVFKVVRDFKFESDYDRYILLIYVVPYFPEVLPETLKAVRAMAITHSKLLAVRSLQNLASCFPEVLPEALEATRAIESQSKRAELLVELASCFPEVLPEALEATRAIESKSNCVEALARLASCFPEVLPEALEAARVVESKSNCVEALARLASSFPKVLPEALEATRAIESESDRVKALARLASSFPEVLPEALEAARVVESKSNCVEALARLASSFPKVLPEALESVRREPSGPPRNSFDSSLEDIINFYGKVLHFDYPPLPLLSFSLLLFLIRGWKQSEVLPEALEVVRILESESDRTEFLQNLSPHLSANLLVKALKYARVIGDESNCNHTLVELACLFPEVLPEALEVIRTVERESERKDFLLKVVPYVSLNLLPEALEVVRTIESESNRAKALVELAYHFPEVLSEALKVIRSVERESERKDFLLKVVPYVSLNLLPEALEVVRTIESESDRAEALVELAYHFPEVLSEALETTKATGSEFYRAKLLVELACHFPEVLPEALEAIRSVERESERKDFLLKVVPSVSLNLLPESLEVVRTIEAESDRAEALVELVRRFPEVLPDALETIEAFESLYERMNAIVRLVSVFPEEFPEGLKLARQLIGDGYPYEGIEILLKVVPSIPLNSLPETLEVVRTIEPEAVRTRFLWALVSYLPSNLLPKALEIAKTIKFESDRWGILNWLGSYLPPSLFSEAVAESYIKSLEAARNLTSERNRAKALEKLVHRFPKVLPEALEAARAIRDEQYRAETLERIASSFPEVLPETLEAARAIRDEQYRAETLGRIASSFPEVLPEALEAARAIGNEQYRAEELQRLVVRLNSIFIDLSFLNKTLYSLATLNRSHFLKNLPYLAPLVIKIGGIEALREITKAIKEVSRWWK